MRQAGVVLIALMVVPLLGSPSAASEDPLPWWRDTTMDLDADGIHDALDVLADDDAIITFLLAYARAPTARELDAIRDIANVTFVPTHFPLVAVEARARDAPRLRDMPGVVFVEADDIIRPLLKQSGPLIGADQVWREYRVTGAGVTVAILDDGAFEQHPDFAGKITASFNAAAAGGPFGDNQAASIVAPASEKGHGTHVAGVVAGSGLEGDGAYKGIAYGATFVNVQVFAAAEQTSSQTVLRGLDWTLANRASLGIRVATMSLGGSPSDGKDALSRAVNIASDEGLIVVAAAGNAGPGAQTITSPGAAEKAITVGAVDKRKRISDFSSRGPTLDGRIKPDLVAPGADIVSTVPPSSTSGIGGFLGGNSIYYGSLSGTSMAAPHVAGVVALMLEANPALSPFDVKRILLVTAQDKESRGPDNSTGYGFVNAIAAVQVAEDPTLLSLPQFGAVLATIPEPGEESMLDRLSYAYDRAGREGMLGVYALGIVVAIALIVVLAVVLRRRRPSLPP